MIKKFSLPGFYMLNRYLYEFLVYYEKHRDFFYEDRIIDSIYDCHPSVLWAGGREFRREPQIPMDEIFDEFQQFPSIHFRYVFTNSLLTPEMMNDYRSNQFVKKYIRPQDKVIINSPYLIEHFEKNYPNIEIIYSTTLDIKDIDKVNELTEKRIYVLNHNMNNNNEYLAQLKHKENIEVICADPCIFQCPLKKWHYDRISETLLYNAPHYQCTYWTEEQLDDIFHTVMTRPQAITNERVEELSNMGIQYFKISGREAYVPEWIEFLLYYLAKPEYKDRIRFTLLDLWW